MKFMESFLATRSKLPASEQGAEIPGVTVNGGLSLEESTDSVTGVDRVGGFQSLKSALQGSRNVAGKHHSVALAVEVGGSTPPAAQVEPSVELIRNGDRVEKVIVTCSCCRRIELDCSY